MKKPEWSVSDISKAKAPMDLEFRLPGSDGGWHHFVVLKTKDRLVFGGCCNVGFLESGYMLRDKELSLEEQMQELTDQLILFYEKGPETATKLICNDRM